MVQRRATKSKRLIGILIAAVLIGTSTVATAAPLPAKAKPVTTTKKAFEMGLNSNADIRNQIPRAAALGAKVLRVEYAVNTPVATIAADADLATKYKVRLQPLAGWDNGIQPPDLRPVAQWAKQLGPGGTHWAGKANPYAITDIELGNENSFTYKSGEPASAKYKSIAKAYGIRALQAAKAVNAANPRVGVLVELDDGNTGSPQWINDVLTAGGPQLIQLMHGPTIHPYGPAYAQRIARNFKAMKAKGATKPYYMTEWGIATDNGRNLGDNYNFPANLTYAATADLMTKHVNLMRANPQLHQVLIYQVSDQQPSGSTSNKEAYFGVVKSDGTPKGTLTKTVKGLLIK